MIASRLPPNTVVEQRRVMLIGNHLSKWGVASRQVCEELADRLEALAPRFRTSQLRKACRSVYAEVQSWKSGNCLVA